MAYFILLAVVGKVPVIGTTLKLLAHLGHVEMNDWIPEVHPTEDGGILLAWEHDGEKIEVKITHKGEIESKDIKKIPV